MTPEEYKMQKEERDRKAKEGRARKKHYNKLKEKVLMHEANNFSKLYVVEATNGWRKMFDNSAFIYTYEIAERVGRKATIYSDTDFGVSAEMGTVSIRDFEKFKKDLSALKIKLVYDKDGVAVFHLGYSIPPERLNGYIKRDEVERQKIEKLLFPEEIFPALKRDLLFLNEKVWYASQKMSEWNRQMLGEQMTERTRDMYEDFLMMARGFKDADLFFQEAQMKMERLKCDLALVEHFRILKDARLFGISSQLAAAERELIKSSKERLEDRNREKAEERARAEGRKLAKRSETKDKVMEKAKNGKKK